MYEHFNESPDNLVEIELRVNNLDLFLPVTVKGGLLDFERDEYDLTLTVRVPKQVAEDPKLFKEFYSEKFNARVKNVGYESTMFLGHPKLTIKDKETDNEKVSCSMNPLDLLTPTLLSGQP